MDAHKKQVTIGIAGVLVVGLGAGIFVWQQKQKQISASEALSRIASQSSMTGKAAAPESFQKVADEYANTGGGERALLLAGARFFDEGKFTDAQAQFRKFLSDYPNSDFIGQALIGVAASLEAQGKTADAINAYKNIVEHHSTDSVMPQARLALGRIYESQGELTQARDAYQQLARPDFGSMGQEAAMRLEDLLTKNPALAQPRTPITNSPAPSLK